MEFVKKVQLNIDDNIYVLTTDGWEWGTIVDFSDNNTIRIYVEDLDTTIYYSIEDVLI